MAVLFIVAVLSLFGRIHGQECADQANNCVKFGVLCVEKPQMMKDVCPQTCGFCPKEQPVTSCSDIFDVRTCGEWKKLCSKFDWMKINCQKSCGFCIGEPGCNPPCSGNSYCSQIHYWDPTVYGCRCKTDWAGRKCDKQCQPACQNGQSCGLFGDGETMCAYIMD